MQDKKNIRDPVQYVENDQTISTTKFMFFRFVPKSGNNRGFKKSTF